MAEVIVVIGAGQIGQALACRVGMGKHVLLANMRREIERTTSSQAAS